MAVLPCMYKDVSILQQCVYAENSKKILLHLFSYMLKCYVPFVFQYGNKGINLHIRYQIYFSLCNSCIWQHLMFLETCCIDLIVQFPVTQAKIIVLMLGISVAELNYFCPEHFDSVWIEVIMNVWSHCFLRIFHVKHQMLMLNRNVCALPKTTDEVKNFAFSEEYHIQV